MTLQTRADSPKTLDRADALRRMLTIRGIEARALALSQATQPAVIGSIHLCAGQEAIPVGAQAALRPDDQIVATYRGHGWALMSGLTPLEVLGEICHRQIGVNGGRGGSAYMMAPSRGFIGENSIVGGGVPIACGVAMANVAAGNGKLVLVSVGDGAFNQGATHEGLAFAAARSLPLLIVCENNGWSEMTATSEMFRVERIAQRAAGYGIGGVTIDGTDPAAVHDTMRVAAERARGGGGPVLIECRAPRLWGHYNRDLEHYRSKEDRQAAAARDPIARLQARLLADGVLSQHDIEALTAKIDVELDQVVAAVLAAPHPDPATASDHVWAPVSAPTTPEAAETTSITYIQAVNEALRHELQARPEVLVYGEDVGKAGGIFAATRNLQRTFGADRVFDTPIAESAILGSAVGAAICGFKPVVEIMWADFLLVALDQIINQAANIRYVTGGEASAPIVVRTQQGVTPGSCAQHSQSLEALLAHIPGLRVALPASPQDAYDLLRSAIASSDPCIVIESRALYQTKADVRLYDQAEPVGGARLVREGEDALIVTWGSLTPACLEASERLARDGVHAAVLNMRWLSPLDHGALLRSARKSGGRVVVAHEANLTGGFGAEIVAGLHEAWDGATPLRISRVATPDVRMPAAPGLQQALVPNANAVVAAVEALLSTAARQARP